MTDRSPLRASECDWQIITGEYPPQRGGVSDYTHLVASRLAAAGDTVTVWCPATGPTDADTPGVQVRRELGRISALDLWRADRRLNAAARSRRILVQWVPHAYRFRSLNLPFCLWLWKRARHDRDTIEVMIHEPYLVFGRNWRQIAAAVMHRVMTVLLLASAQRVWVAIPAWEAVLRPYALGRRLTFGWLPVPSNVPVIDDPTGVEVIRARYAPVDAFLVGHFGTFGPYATAVLRETLPLLLRRWLGVVVLLLGSGSEQLRCRIARDHPDCGPRLHATGYLNASDLSRHLSACHVMLQPYEDGVSTRRGSMMAVLSHGVPVVTTAGRLTESIWAQSRAVVLTPPGDRAGVIERVGALLKDPDVRKAMTLSARALYDARFDIRHTLDALRTTSASAGDITRAQLS